MKIEMILVLGLVSGLKHAFDADHIAAVSALVSKNKKVVTAVKAGVWWGIGHTFTLMLVGLAVLVFGLFIPEKVATGFEFFVALMLITLGLANLRNGILSQFHFHLHKHDDDEHLHIHKHAEGSKPHDHAHHHPNRGKAFAIGAIHGLAGSAAVTLLILSTIKSVPAGLIYILLFGVGSVAGMALFSMIICMPMLIASRRYDSFQRFTIAGSGLLSLIIGVGLVHEIAGPFFP